MSNGEPRNAVENPIINSPFEEPAQHYDFSGAAARIEPHRRRAGYYGISRTDRGADVALTHHQFISLDLVNEIRPRVKAWRERGYPNVTTATRDLLDHWNDPERQGRLFFCQREAVETLIWLVEGTEADRQGIDVPLDAPNDLDSLSKGYAALRRFCCKMATGSGKTTVMAMVAAWSIINKVMNRQDPRFADAVLVVCPNLTVKERLRVLTPQAADSYYAKFDLVPAGYRDILARGRVLVTNWHAFLVRDDGTRRGVVQRGRESDAAFAKRILQRELGNASGLLVLNDEAHHAYRPAPPHSEDMEKMTAEERREAQELAEEATVWVGGLDRINKARGIRMVVDLSATPFFLKGSGHTEGTPLPWIVSDFGLVDAIECGICKVPRIPVLDDSGRPDPKYFKLWETIMKRLPDSERETVKRRAKPDSVWREAQGALVTLAGKWQATAEHFTASQFQVPPVLIVVAANTQLSGVMAEALRRGEVIEDLAGDHTFAIDSKVLAEAEAAGEGTKNEAQELLRLKTATVGKDAWPEGRPPEGLEHLAEPPGKDVRCVVSVGMLTEGWDAQNVTQILGLRAFSSQLLCEQVVGRGLRRMSYQVNENGLLEPEYCDVFGIPFEVIPVQGTTERPSAPPPPSTLVQALDERKHLEITWPRVEGFVVDVRQRIKCDVDKVPRLSVSPSIEPTSVVIRSQMGWVTGKAGLNTTTGDMVELTRERFYAEHRVQRTVFEIARDITEVLAGGKVSMGAQPVVERRIEAARLLFPQVLAVVERYVQKRVSRVGDARIEEIALEQYRSAIVERLVAAIEPDEDEGEPPILPRIDRQRPVGSTAGVQFRTTRPTMGTAKSHISHVVLDSNWESSAAARMEMSSHVLAYAKNDHLGFEIFYEWRGQPHKYVPDYLVRIDGGEREPLMVILEIKGLEGEQDRAKYQAAARWCSAVNNHGGFGRWIFAPTRKPHALAAELEKFHRMAREQMASEGHES
jgi:type III restriction enzyme